LLDKRTSTDCLEVGDRKWAAEKKTNGATGEVARTEEWGGLPLATVNAR